jgi:hypothetical protein
MYLRYAAALLVVATACQDPGKGPESGLPGDAKADSFKDPTAHEETEADFGLPWPAELNRDERFHFWSFYLHGPAQLELLTRRTPAGDDVDTVMYLYRNDPATSGWSSYIARNDDHGDSVFSRIELNHSGDEPTEYGVMIKGHDTDVEGWFSLLVSCNGTCAEAEPAGEHNACDDLEDWVTDSCLPDDDSDVDFYTCLASHEDGDMTTFANDCCDEGDSFIWCGHL